MTHNKSCNKQTSNQSTIETKNEKNRGDDVDFQCTYYRWSSYSHPEKIWMWIQKVCNNTFS